PVEAVAPDLVATVERVGNCVQVGVRRQRLMERRIEHRDLRNVAERLAHGSNAFQVVRVVQRREVDHLLDLAQHDRIDLHRLAEPLTAVNDAVADRIDVAHRGEVGARLLAGEPAQHGVDCRPVVADRPRRLQTAIPRAEAQQRLTADALDDAACESLVRVVRHALLVRAHELELECRGAGVQDEDVHRFTCPGVRGCAHSSRMRAPRKSDCGLPGDCRVRWPAGVKARCEPRWCAGSRGPRRSGPASTKKIRAAAPAAARSVTASGGPQRYPPKPSATPRCTVSTRAWLSIALIVIEPSGLSMMPPSVTYVTSPLPW